MYISKTLRLTSSKSYVRYSTESPKIPRPGATTTSGPVSLLRRFRTWHRAAGLALLLLLLVSSLTGMALAWKKNVATLQPPTQKGTSPDLRTWIPVGETAAIAGQALQRHLAAGDPYPIERIEARPDKGIWKVIFDKGYWEVQVDGQTGRVLSVARRHSDWIEQLHDGSLFGEAVKLVSMNTLGLGLLLMLVTGFWLYYGPRRLRAARR